MFSEIKSIRRYGDGTNGTQWQSHKGKYFLSYGGRIYGFHLAIYRFAITFDSSHGDW